ncbi:hypothetical protein C9374_005755 [Naegleria lovaniensis]|uniref:Uncharacterized protein n=1 Tax=Naegleria lovaniensis TaxID=51637 RepID=A0AA88KJK8_NAELO|nr:uncharacterized protein C9374_005755 [Naegleria lovaniensis]KAG2381963.1 hypothetical protein C9374_005755 [Naegleria lovaniensis]
MPSAEQELSPLPIRSSIIQSVISEARSMVENGSTVIAATTNRASILKPSRPFTPRDNERRLFVENEYATRPTSAFSSSNFDFSYRKTSSSSGTRDETNQDSNNSSRSNTSSSGGTRKKKPSSSGSKRTGSSKSSSRSNECKEEEVSETVTYDKIWHSIDSIVTSLETLNEEQLLDTMDSLHLLIEKLQPTPKDDERKGVLVSKLSKFLDIGNAELTVKICSIILTVTRIGQHILQICKIMFKISKQEKYDKLFKDDKIILPILHLLNQEFTTESYHVSWEILLFTIGTLKNISYDSNNQKTLVKHHIVSQLSLLMSSALRELKTGGVEKVNKQAQLLVQILATLRNLATRSSTFKQFLEYNVIDNIHILMNALMSHSEFIHNATRVLSKLSLDDTCVDEMRRIENLKSCLVNVLREHRKHMPIVVRVTFILGNLTFENYSGQEKFNEKTEIPFLLDLLDLYSLEDDKPSKENVKKETEDLLTKLIRLIANISMDEKQGKLIAQSKPTVRLLEIIEKKKVQDCEELILNTLRCITNLSFYAFSIPSAPLFIHKLKLASLLSSLLFHDHNDVVYEATRSFGNLSQDAQVREYMHKSRIDEALIIMIEHGNLDIVYAVCGVLVNLSSDPNGTHLELLKERGAIEKLIDVLERSTVALALVVLKIFHNICLNVESKQTLSSLYTKEEVQHLDALLQSIIQDDHVEQMTEYDISMVRDLTSVAKQLIQCIISK